MAIANQSAVADARTLFETLTESALAGARATGSWQRVARWADATGVKHTSIIPGATPSWGEFAGTRVKKGFRKLTKETGLKTYDKYMRLPRISVEQDPDGSTKAAIQQFVGADVAAVYDYLVFTALDANPTGADGVSLINDSHPYGPSTTWDNKTTDALTFDSFNTEVERMMELHDEWDEPLNLVPRVLVVSTSLRREALEITKADSRPISVGTAGAINTAGIGATGLTNIYQAEGWEVVVTSRFSSGNWVIIDPRFLPLKLCVWNQPRTVIVDSMEAHQRVENDEFVYGVEIDARADGEQPWGIAGKIA